MGRGCERGCGAEGGARPRLQSGQRVRRFSGELEPPLGDGEDVIDLESGFGGRLPQVWQVWWSHWRISKRVRMGMAQG